MANSFVQLNTGTGGNKAQTFLNTIGANSVDANAVSLVDQFGIPIGGATATATITATDAVVAAPAGAGAFVSGASTAGSISAIQVPGGDSIFNCQITGLTSGTLWFESSLDSTNGTDGNWMNTVVLRDGVLQSNVQQNATANGLYSGNCSGFGWMRARSVGTLTGTPVIRWRLSPGTSEVFLTSSIPPGTNAIGKVETESAKPTYTASAFVAPAAVASSEVVNIRGVANKIIRLKFLSVTAQATATGSVLALLLRRTTANTGGTSATATIAPHSTTSAASSVLVTTYSANPTLGTVGPTLAIWHQQLTAPAGPQVPPVTFRWTDKNDEAPTLRSASEYLSLNFNTAPGAGASICAMFTWTEE
jgi:hypothetical protein